MTIICFSNILHEKPVTNLGDGVSQQVRVSGGAVENTERNRVGRPLDFMNCSLHPQSDQSRIVISHHRMVSKMVVISVPAHRASALCLQNLLLVYLAELCQFPADKALRKPVKRERSESQ